MPPLPNDQYHLGWICALTEEVAASRAMLDEVHGKIVEQDAKDQNSYTAGRIHNHNLIIARLPAGKYGIVEAAAVAKDMARTFPNLKFGLMVGIGGGLPSPTTTDTVRLGDVVVSQPEGTHGGVIQFDLGKRLSDGKFIRKGTMDAPPSVLLTALGDLQAEHELEDSKVPEYIAAALERYPKLAKGGYSFPGVHRDLLFQCDLEHVSGKSDCSECDVAKLIPRVRDDDHPRVIFGTILSSSLVVKDAVERDRLRDEYDALCVEMEAAGLMNIIPSLVVRGICDYADTHKNDVWHKYAALAAAAFTKELLLFVSPSETSSQQPLKDSLHIIQDQLKPIVAFYDCVQSGNDVHAERERLERERLDREKLERELQECHRALMPATSYKESKNIVPRRAPDTCKWVLQDDKYLEWKKIARNDLLWISADPGCGKSVFSRTLIDEILARSDNQNVCYFFFRDRTGQNTLSLALCAILHQLFTQQENLRRLANQAYKQHGSQLQQETDELWQIFMKATTDNEGGRPTICIIDALDEASATCRRSLIKRLCEFYNKYNCTTCEGFKLKFLVTSRPYDTVQEPFEQLSQSLPKIRLRGEDKNSLIGEEIDIVIRNRVDEIAQRYGITADAKSRLQERLLGMQHRTYLWLHLALDDINKTYRQSPDPDSVVIQTLPESVDAAYEKILEKVDKTVRFLVRRLLLIIVGARRALTVGELCLASGMLAAASPTCLADIRVNQLHMAEHMREWCGLFIFFNDGKVYLLHQTAKEFLVRKGDATDVSPSGFWRGSINTLAVERTMAQLCMDYVTLKNFRDPTSPTWHSTKAWILAHLKSAETTSKWLLDSNKTGDKADVANDFKHDLPVDWEDAMQLFDYASSYWHLHANSAELQEDHPMWPQIARMYKDQYHGYDLWPIYIWEIASSRVAELGLGPFYHWNTIRGIHLLMVTQQFKVLEVSPIDDEASSLCDSTEGFKIEQRMDTGETPLIFAAMMKYTAGLRWLLKKGADISAVAPVGTSFWEKAFVALNNVLYPDYAATNTQTKNWDALDHALWHNHTEAVSLLLSAGADPNNRGSQHRPLNRALQFDHMRCVHLLLDHGVPMEKEDWETAAKYRRDQFLDGQLDKRIAQQWNGKLDLDVWMSLARDADGALSAMLFRRLLHHDWSKELDLEIWKTIVRRAPDEYVEHLLNKQVEQGLETPIPNGALQEAIIYERAPIVKLLLEHDSPHDFDTSPYGTPLQAVFALRHHNNNFKTPEDDPENKAGLGLAFTGNSPRIDILAMLLKAGVDVNAPGRQTGQSPLQRACLTRNKTVIEMMLAAGAEIENANLWNIDDDVLLTLFRAKAINVVRLQEHLNRVLRVACSHYNENRAKMLLEHGANVNALDEEQCTTLRESVLAGRLRIVKLLLDYGAGQNLQGALEAVVEYQSTGAAHFDFDASSWAMARLLLDAGANAAIPRDQIWWTLLRVLRVRPKCPPNHTISKVFFGLLKAGAEPNVDIAEQTDCAEHTRPLHIACSKGNHEHVRMLLDAGVDVNLPTENCPYPLEIACAQGQTQIASMLINAGANPQNCSLIMPYPLQSACMAKDKPLVEMLLKRGADPNICDGYNGTPLQIAQRLGCEEILALLQSH